MAAELMFLLGYPLGVFANYSHDKLKTLSRKLKADPLKDLLLAAFYEALKEHGKRYDEAAGKYAKRIKKAVKKDEQRLLRIMCAHHQTAPEVVRALQQEQYPRQVLGTLVQSTPPGTRSTTWMSLRPSWKIAFGGTFSRFSNTWTKSRAFNPCSCNV